MDGYKNNGLTPFKAWLFRKWPYLISDDMTELDILYTILGKFAETLEEFEQLKEDFKNFQNTMNQLWEEYKNDMNASWDAYQDKMDKAFQDFQNTINDKISEFESAWAEFQQTMQQEFTEYKNSLNSEWEAYKENIDSKITAIQNEWTSFKSQLDNEVASLESEWENFKKTIDGTVSDLEEAWSSYKTTMDSSFQSFQNTVNSKLTTFENTTIPNTVQEEFDSRLPQMVEDEVAEKVPTEVAEQIGTKIGTLNPNTAAIVGSDGKLASSAVTSTELDYLDGTKSNIQGQIDALDTQIDDIEAGIPTGGPFAGSDTAGGAANSLKNALTINLNGTTTVYDGSSARSVTINTDTGGGEDDRIGSLTPGRAAIVNGEGKLTSSDITSTELSYLDGASSNIQGQIDALENNVDALQEQIPTGGPFAGSASDGGPARSAVNLSPTYSDDTANDIDALLAAKIQKIVAQAGGANGMFAIDGGWNGQNFGSTLGAFFQSTQSVDAFWFIGNRIWSRRRNGANTLEDSRQYIPADKNGNISFNRVQWTDNDFMAEYIYNCLKNAGYSGITPGGGTEDYPASGYTQLTTGETYWGNESSSPVITVDIQVQSKRENGVLYYMFKTYIEVQVKTAESYYGYPIYGSLTLNGSAKVDDYLIVFQDGWNGGATWTTGWIEAANNKTGENPAVITIDSGSYSGSGGRAAQSYSFTV